MSGLNMAATRGLNFGSEVIFTYGPLGFLKTPLVWYSDLSALTFMYQAATFYLFVFFMVRLFRKRVSDLVACLIAFLFVACVPGIDYAVGIAVMWAFIALTDGKLSDREKWLLVVLGGVFSAAECQMKISTGPLVFLVLLLGLKGSGARIRDLSAFVSIFVGSYLALWLATGQVLGDLPSYVRDSVDLFTGYSGAMSAPGVSDLAIIAIAGAAIGTTVWAWFGEYPSNQNRILATLIAALVCFSFYKEGVVRAGHSHLVIGLTAIAVVWLSVPIRARLLSASVAGLVLISAISINQFPYSGQIDMLANIKSAAEGARTLLDSNRRQEIVDQGRARLRSYYAIDPEVLRQIGDQPVSVDPYEIAAAWAYDLNWSPLPVFQNYSAYTERLDEINSESISSSNGPTRILRSNISTFDSGDPVEALDGRYRGWDPPRQQITTICNFIPTLTTETWQDLSRTNQRCDSPVPAGEVEARSGETVSVPAPGKQEMVFARIHGLNESGFEILKSILYKPGAITATTSDGASYRLIRTTASDGLMLRSNGIEGQNHGPFAQIPQTTTLKINGATGNLKIEFFRMGVAKLAADTPLGEGA